MSTAAANPPPDSHTPPYIIREINSDDDVLQICIEKKEFVPLKEFLRDHASNHHEINVSKTYVAVASKRVLAYITLCCSQVHFDSPPKELPSIPYRFYPSVRIGQLAVDENFRKRDIGSKLVSLAIALVKQKIQPHVGCRLLTVDSHQDAVTFYKERGFCLVDTKKNLAKDFPVMFLDIGKL